MSVAKEILKKNLAWHFTVRFINKGLALKGLKRQYFVFHVIGKELYNTFVIVFTWGLFILNPSLTSGNFSCITVELT